MNKDINGLMRHDKLIHGILPKTKAYKELIRLQKETHLLEHDFYDEEIQEYYNKRAFDKNGRTKFGREYRLEYTPYKEKLKKLWFKQFFPEFFEKDK
jgi:hypothetical protein